MAEQPQSFGQWIQQNANRYPALTALSTSVPDFSSMPKGPNAPATPGDVLGSLVDIISRPLYGVTETIDSSLEGREDWKRVQEKWEAGDGWGAVGEHFGNLGKNLTAPVRGMFSTHEDDKRLFSDLIEKGTDAFGTEFNPNYVDVQDNVNPVLKGGLGLVGDIAMDPLTWVPGAGIAAVLSKIGKTANNIGRGGRAVEEIAEEAGEVASEAFQPQLALPVGSTKFEANATGNVGRDWEGNLPEGTNLGAPIPKPAKTAEEMIFEPAAQKIVPGLRQAEAPAVPASAVARVTIITKTGEDVMEFATAKEAAQFVAGLNKQGIKRVRATTKRPRLAEGEARYRVEKVDDTPVAAAPSALGAVQAAVSEAPAKAMSDLLESISKAGPVQKPLDRAGWMSGLRGLKDARQPKIEVIFNGNVKRVLPVSKAYELARNQTSPVLNRAEIQSKIVELYESYTQAFAKRPIGVDGTPIAGGGATNMARFWDQIAADEAGMEMVLGGELLNRLKAVTNPETFDLYISQMQTVLKATGALDDARIIAPGSIARQMLERVGIDPATYAKPAVVAAKKQVAEAVEESIQPGATPDKIVESIKKMSDDLEDMDPNSYEAMITRDVAGALEEVIRKNIDEPLDPQGRYFTEAAGGAKRDNIEFGKGLGADVPMANTHLEWDLFVAITKRVTQRVDKTYKDLKNKPFAGEKRAKAVEAEVMDALRYAEKVLIKERAPIHFDLDGERVRLTLSQVYDLLAKSDPKVHDTLRMTLFNAGTAMAPTKFMEAIVVALRPGASTDDVLATLASVEKRNSKIDGEPIKSFFEGADTGTSNYGYYGHRPVGRGESIKKPPANTDEYIYAPSKSGKGWEVRYASVPAAQRLAQAIMDSVDDLRVLSVENAVKYQKQLDTDDLAMTPPTLERLSELGNTPAKMAEALRVMGKPERMAKSVYDEAGAIRREAATRAEVMAKAAVPEQVQEAAEAATKVASAVRQGRMEDAAKISQRAFERRVQQDRVRDAQLRAARGLPEDDSLPMPDPYAQRLQAEAAERAAQARRVDESGPEVGVGADSGNWARDTYPGIMSGVMKFLDPLDKIFNAKAGMIFKFGEDALNLYHLRHKGGILARTIMVSKIRGLRDLEKKYGDIIDGTKTTYLEQAFKHLQKGPEFGTPMEPRVRAAHDELQKYMSDLLGVPGKLDDAVLGNVFFRNGLPGNEEMGLEYLNDIFGAYQVLGKNAPPNTVFFDIDLAKADRALALKNGNDLDIMSWASDQWRNWDVKDPIEFMSRLNAAAINMAVDVSVSQSFVQMARKAGLMSMKPRPGYARLKVEGKSRYAALIAAHGGEGAYYPKELLNALKRMDEVGRTSKGLDSELGKFIHEIYDPLLNTWKYAITLPRPGHHVRNFVGDTSMTYLAEGTQFFKRAADDAFKVLSLRNNYTGVDVMRALNQNGAVDLPKAGTVISSGRYGDLTAEGILQLAKNSGILPPAHVIEDVFSSDKLLPEASGLLSTGLEKIALRGGKIEDFVGGVSEYRDHYSRLQHFIQFIHKAQKSGGYKSQEAMIEAAAVQIMKWHPDVSLLSTAETKYMRRLIPFYSWFRGAVPAIAESLVLNPARVNIFNKASYNLAVAMGVNPNTLYDPFPEDQLFPSYLTEQMEGPQFQIGDAYFRLNPGLATWDVLNMLGPDPIRGVAGATSPLLRVPAEMLSGGSWGTGARINDMSDYLDASIPGVNYVSNFTGNSVTGSIASLLQGQGFDPQFQHAAGNKGPGDQGLSFANWLTGAGIANYSRPNIINYAEIEKRNREGEQRGF